MARQPRLPLAVLVCLLLAPMVAAGESVVSGSVRDEAGKPLVGVIVRLMDAEPGGRHTSYSEESDARGLFTFEDIPRSLYKVSVQSLVPGVRFTVWWPDVEVSRARQSLDLRLPRTGVTGKLEVKDGGAMPRATLTLQRLVPRRDGPGETIGGLAGMAWPEPDGTYRFRGIPPGRYRLYLTCRDFRRVERDLTVPKRKLLACQDLVLERLRSGVVRVRVTDAEGRPVDGLDFSYLTPDGISHGVSAERVEPGVYSITQLETGTWLLLAYRRGHGATRFEVTVAEGKTTSLEVREGAGIRGAPEVTASAPGDRTRADPDARKGAPAVRETPPGPFEDEAEARALYERMVAAMRAAKTLSWVSEYVSGSDRYGEGSRCSYAIWLARPDRVRLEASRRGVVTGILVGDGRDFWTHWPAGRPRRNHEQHGKAARTWERTRDRCYMRKRSPAGRHSIGHETGPLGAGLTMPILDPSTFHGYTDSLQAYVDGYRRLGEEAIDGEACDVIEVSIMKGQRSWRLWLSKRDSLPRRLEQVIRARLLITTVETWSDVRIDEDVPAERFAWKPPAGWVVYRPPTARDGLLKVGSLAPDFDLPLNGGGRIRLSECRGRVVWFYLWRAG